MPDAMPGIGLSAEMPLNIADFFPGSDQRDLQIIVRPPAGRGFIPSLALVIICYDGFALLSG
jgi:hypothetical protein